MGKKPMGPRGPQMSLFDEAGCLKAEFAAKKLNEEQVKAADADANGCITREEFKNAMPKPERPEGREGRGGFNGPRR
jgi:hypothetical protein